MADLDLELQKRNARFRAWKALGVPLDGGWKEEHLVSVDPRTMRAVSDSTPTATLKIGCTLCDSPTYRGYGPGSLEVSASLDIPTELAEQELVAVARLACHHLDPLLQPDPPELAALYELELLAGA
jgi:hypothetical protein